MISLLSVLGDYCATYQSEFRSTPSPFNEQEISRYFGKMRVYQEYVWLYASRLISELVRLL